jgi:hypothetical protein
VEGEIATDIAPIPLDALVNTSGMQFPKVIAEAVHYPLTGYMGWYEVIPPTRVISV